MIFLYLFYNLNCVARLKELQEQPSRGFPFKRWSENRQQIYRRTPMSKCDFNKVAGEDPCRSAVSIKLLGIATLLKSHFGTGVLQYICWIFSEHLFLRTPLEGCFWHWLVTVLFCKMNDLETFTFFLSINTPQCTQKLKFLFWFFTPFWP